MKNINLIKCVFDIGFNVPIQQVIDKAKTEIIKAGGTFQGDINSGKYSVPILGGAIVGTYKVQGSAIHFEISEKPSIISCKKIESELRKLMSLYFNI